MNIIFKKMRISVILFCVFVVKYSCSAPQSIEENDVEEHFDDVIDLSHLGAGIYGVPKPEAGKILDEWDPETDGEFIY